MERSKIIILSMVIVFVTTLVTSADGSESERKKKSWRDKDIRDMTEADLEHLLDQWEENEEPLEPDELPEYLRPSPKIDLSKIDATNPDDLLRATKKGKGVMMFVDIIASVSEEQAEVAMRIWQTSLQNNHIIAERYPIEPRRCIFMFREGSQAIDAKNYLLEQPKLSHLTLEGHTYYRDAQQQATADESMRRQSANAKQNKVDL